MGGLRLREFAIRLWLGGVNQIRKFDGILDKEHRDVIADQIPISFERIKFDRKSANVTRRIGGSLVARDGGKPDEYRCAHTHAVEYSGFGYVRQGFRQLEVAMRGGASGVHNALGNPLMVEVIDLFAKEKILEEDRAARADFQLVFVVGYNRALVRGERRVGTACELVQFTGIAGCFGCSRAGAGRHWIGYSRAPGFVHILRIRHFVVLSCSGLSLN